MLTRIIPYVAVAAALTTSFAQAHQTTGVAPSEPATVLRSLPPDASTVTNWYKQNVHDPSEEKAGEIADVLVDRDGKVSAFIVSVGGFLGVGEKHVAVPFNMVHAAQKNASGG
jgi:sporulation protein YlmC with PRC-barrel domain